MIDISLVEQPVNIDNFESKLPFRPSLFLGFILKNEYDNKRLKIKENYNPKKFVYICEEEKKLDIIPLYGILLKLNGQGVDLTNLIQRQIKANNINLVVYENLLSQYNLKCDDCYGYFRKGVYPIDFNKFRGITDDEISKDKKILQHMLELNESKFDFQKFGSIISLILI
jgi:hypothetical protein|tara:strand:- start:25 stop:534 length:510 start_codon:yes stop_codon:yes gene_type:complete